MIVSLKHRFVFLCMTKCASTSIHAALAPYGEIAISAPPSMKHTNFRDYEALMKPYVAKRGKCDDLETLCLFREPIEWLYSWYRFRARYDTRGTENSTSHVTFSEFVEAHMSPNPPIFADVGSQFNFVKTETGDIGVDKIFAYDDLNDFIAYVEGKIGASLDLQRLNVSPQKRHESNTGALIERFRGKIRNKLSFKHPAPVVKEKNFGLSDEVHGALLEFLADECRVYEMAKERNTKVAVASR